MSTKRRQSSTYSAEEPFEFVDYTSVSNFERLVTQIENTISAWGLRNGAFGIFSDEQISAEKAALGGICSEECTRQQVISIGDEVFHFSYHYQPTTAENDTFPLAAENFYRFHSQQYHPLHRWSGQNRLLILSPVNDSIKKRLFLGGRSSIEIHQAKHLISACATAFQHAGCQVPAFTPIGQENHDMYIGYMQTVSSEGHSLNNTEVRFNMTIVTPPSSLSCLDELKSLFIQKLCARREDCGKPGYNEEDVWTTAVYTYDLKNWFESDWKQWPETEVIRGNLNTRGGFSDEFESLNHQTEQFKKQLDEHKLPFGSYNDPLRSLTLSALFPFWQDGFYDDSQSTNMDALTAKRWILSRKFAPKSQQRADLSTLIEQIIDSWIKDPSNREYLAPYDEGNDEYASDRSLHRGLFSVNASHSNSSSASSSAADSSGGLRIGDEQVTVVKSDQIEEMLDTLFADSTYISSKEQQEDNKEFLDSKRLMLKLKSNSCVPYKSLLWDLLLFTIEALASNNLNSNNRRQNFADFMGFFRIVWAETLRKIRWHWEKLEPIPKMNPFLYDSDGEIGSDKTLGIDLRFNILFQKLSMINCCIHRKRQDNNIKATKNTSDHNYKILSSNTHENGTQSKKTVEDSDSTDEFFDTVEDTDGSLNTENQQSLDEEVEESAENSHPLAGSYVRLPFIAQFHSEEVKAAVIKDINVSEGRLHEHKEGLKLLKTGEPLHVPITQDPGFMTEDMIREQAEAFENMGSSDHATLRRAQLQSQQLYSDMQAFKAANPHACLEDFIRWHSPRDWIVPEGKSNEEGCLSKRMSEPNNIWQELWNCSRRIPCTRQKPLFDICLIAYDTLAAHPAAECSRYVAHELSLFGNKLIEFPWDEFRNGKQTFDDIVAEIRQLEATISNNYSSLAYSCPGNIAW
ncbi:hypothetical protein G6F43_000869 [Rhizopus delemar]|nr:hypothetical protein G6F43_000869 [Rhizopus delemar]